LRAGAKHRGGEINMTLPTSIGTYAFLKSEQQCPPGLIENILRSLSQMKSEPSGGDVSSLGAMCTTSYPGAFLAQVELVDRP